MIVGSIKENINLEKRVSITPETAKNIIALGLSINLEKSYAVHLGIEDKQYEKTGVNFFGSANEVMNNSDNNTVAGANNSLDNSDENQVCSCSLPTRTIVWSCTPNAARSATFEMFAMTSCMSSAVIPHLTISRAMSSIAMSPAGPAQAFNTALNLSWALHCSTENSGNY